MNDELLYRYIKCQTSAEEETLIADWLDADPAHAEHFHLMCRKVEALTLIAPTIDRHHAADRRQRNRLLRIIRHSAIGAAAAALLAGAIVFTAQLTRTRVHEEIGQMHHTITAQGAPLHLTLADGSSVWLNNGTTLEYPALFAGGERTVHLTGEAMFDVQHDADRPFIVHTSSCNIRVIGTRFNVLADAAGERFETALLRGRIEVSNPSTQESILLNPSEIVTLSNGSLIHRQLTDPDDYLWTDGYINLKGHTFAELIDKYRRTFNVTIRFEGELKVPDTKYWWGRICVHDGIDNAMKVLRNAFPIEYTFDSDTRTVTVRNR